MGIKRLVKEMVSFTPTFTGRLRMVTIKTEPTREKEGTIIKLSEHEAALCIGGRPQRWLIGPEKEVRRWASVKVNPSK